MKSMITSRTILFLLAVMALGILAGCSSKNAEVNVDEEIQQRDERISQLEAEAKQTETELENTRKAAENAAKRAAEAEELAQAVVVSEEGSSFDSEMLPPNAKVGECYARVLVPPVYEQTTEQMLVKEASSTIEIIPAKYEWIEEEVLVKEAGERLIVIPATYKTVEEKRLVKEASSKMVEVPAVYETVTEKILVTPAREYWKKGRGPIEKVDGSTGEIMCLVKEEAVYKTVTKKILKTEATTREEAIPAEYKTITSKVIDTPASTRTEVIPAEYGTVKVRKLISSAREVRTPIKEEYRTVTKSVMAEASYMEWRQILCETNMNQSTVLDIQKALKAKGFDPGPLDGIYGWQTTKAVTAFQKSKNLASGQLTFETVDALGL